MGFFTWIGFGPLVGVLAKYVMPGRDPGGLLVTMLLVSRDPSWEDTLERYLALEA